MAPFEDRGDRWQLGGATVHNEKSGVAQLLANDEEDNRQRDGKYCLLREQSSAGSAHLASCVQFVSPVWGNLDSSEVVIDASRVHNAGPSLRLAANRPDVDPHLDRALQPPPLNERLPSTAVQCPRRV